MGQVIERLQQKLVDYDINTSRLGLSQSLVASATYKAGGIRIGLSAEFYWKYINEGVNGTEVSHGAPTWGASPAGTSFKQSILEWIPARSIQLPPQFKTFDSFAWAIMTNLKKRGMEPRPFFDDVVNPSLLTTLKEPIERLFQKAITISIVGPWQ